MLSLRTDLSREEFLKKEGWQVIRFSDSEVVEDIESIGIAVAKVLGVEYEFVKTVSQGSGMKRVDRPAC